MSDAPSDKEFVGDVETALLDADLFIKYQAHDRAFKRLRESLERHPRSIPLREKIREIAQAAHQPEEAARQCLALARLYIEREDLQTAHDRLFEAKQHDPRVSIAPGLEAIRRARHPDAMATVMPVAPVISPGRRSETFSGDLTVLSLFDVIQVLENSRLTGTLEITRKRDSGRVFFNEGQIVGAEMQEETGEAAFRHLIEETGGVFDFEISGGSYPVTINASSNTSLLLDSLRQLDEENQS